MKNEKRTYDKMMSQSEAQQVHQDRQEKTRWTKKQDCALKKIMKKYKSKPKEWQEIADELSKCLGTSIQAKQCGDRWNNVLNPCINRKEWTIEEKRTFIKLHEEHLDDPKTIKKELPGRTSENVKNFFNNNIKKTITAIKKHRPRDSYITEPDVSLYFLSYVCRNFGSLKTSNNKSLKTRCNSMKSDDIEIYIHELINRYSKSSDPNLKVHFLKHQLLCLLAEFRQTYCPVPTLMSILLLNIETLERPSQLVNSGIQAIICNYPTTCVVLYPGTFNNIKLEEEEEKQEVEPKIEEMSDTEGREASIKQEKIEQENSLVHVLPTVPRSLIHTSGKNKRDDE